MPDYRKFKIEIHKKGTVRLEFRAQWVAATSGRVLGAEVRQQPEIKHPQMIKYDGVYMIANNPQYYRLERLDFTRETWL